jgi:hypothetical protein
MNLKRILVVTAILIVPILTAQTTMKFKPFTIENLEPKPDFWRVKPQEIIDVCKSVKRGKAEIIARTPADFPVYAVFYGEFNEPPPQTNWSAGSSSTTWKTYVGEKTQQQTILVCAGIHGAEAESVASLANLIQLLETGKDFRGKKDDAMLRLAQNYRLIILPCVNMDGRAISPDHLRNVDYNTFRAASQGTWADGSLIGWRGSKEYFPLPLDKVSFPGGYPNSQGYNIMHDATPGDVKTAEARALLALVARWRVDLVLNCHSCEHAPALLAPSILDYPANVERGLECSHLVNVAIANAGLRPMPTQMPKPGKSLNLNTLAALSSGALALTLECTVSYDRPVDPTRTYSFDEMLEPTLIMLRTLMEDGLQKPFIDREKL